MFFILNSCLQNVIKGDFDCELAHSSSLLRAFLLSALIPAFFDACCSLTCLMGSLLRHNHWHRRRATPTVRTTQSSPLHRSSFLPPLRDATRTTWPRRRWMLPAPSPRCSAQQRRRNGPRLPHNKLLPLPPPRALQTMARTLQCSSARRTRHNKLQQRPTELHREPQRLRHVPRRRLPRWHHRHHAGVMTRVLRDPRRPGQHHRMAVQLARLLDSVLRLSQTCARFRGT